MSSPWDDYLDAARELDATRRHAAAVVAEQAAAMRAARQELTMVRQRQAIGQARLLDVARRVGLSAPMLAPTEAAADTGDPVRTLAALRVARASLDTADALLSGANVSGASAGAGAGDGPLADWSPASRNSLVYGGFALVVLVVQLVMFFVVDGPSASVAAVGCAAVLPVFGYGAAWLTVGLVFRGATVNGRRGPVDRTPALGVALCAMPVVLLCAGVGSFGILT